MIAYFFLGICLLAAFLLAGRWFVSADPRVLAKALRYLGAGVLGLIALGLLLTGRVGLAVLPALAAIYIIRGGLVPRTMRWPGGGGAAGGGPAGGGGARTSEVETAWLRMSLDHGTGEMRGEVRRGAYAGRELASMSREELLSLLDECRREDPESAQLLETWLDRIQGADWRGADAGGAGGRGSEGDARSGGPMSEREAREVLGVSETAGAEEIRAAYHRMMMKYHPDRGGSAYLAAKINQAKDILLGA